MASTEKDTDAGQAAQPAPSIDITAIAAQTMRVPVVGTAPLIMHRFDEKAKRQMLDAMQGRKAPKAVRDPQADYEAAFYRLKGDGYGFPVTAFKAATVGAARFYAGVTMTELRQFLFMHGEMSADESSPQMVTRIEGEPRMREDYVRLSRTSTDLRYRPEFPEWTTVLTVTFVTSALSQASVLSLIDAGGLGVGVGEWRPEKKGEFGTYRVDPTRNVEVV